MVWLSQHGGVILKMEQLLRVDLTYPSLNSARFSVEPSMRKMKEMLLTAVLGADVMGLTGPTGTIMEGMHGQPNSRTYIAQSFP